MLAAKSKITKTKELSTSPTGTPTARAEGGVLQARMWYNKHSSSANVEPPTSRTFFKNKSTNVLTKMRCFCYTPSAWLRTTPGTCPVSEARPETMSLKRCSRTLVDSQFNQTIALHNHGQCTLHILQTSANNKNGTDLQISWESKEPFHQSVVLQTWHAPH